MSVVSVTLEEIYKKEPKLKKEDIEQLKEWAKKQPHLPEATELQLICFLHSCYFSIELAKKTIDSFFTLRTASSEIFSTPSAEHLKFISDVSYVSILPEKSPEGYSILYYKLLSSNSEVFFLNEPISLIISHKLLHIYHKGPVHGLLAVADVEALTFGHILKCPLTTLINFFTYLTNACPVRIKQIHFYNINTYFDKIFSIAKPFIKKELLELIHLHKSIDGVYDYLPQRYLDFDIYGGKTPFEPLKKQALQHLLDNLEVSKFWDKQTVDESKRIEKSKSNGAFGLDGAFKKLEVD